MRKFEDIQIAVAGTGYVGLSIATLLAQHHKVTAVDVIPEKVEKINNRISPIQDDYIEKYLAEKPLQLTATLDGASAYRDADFVVILDHGQIAAEGTPLTLKNTYTGDFITLYGVSEEEIQKLEAPYEVIRDAFRVSVSNTAAATELILKFPGIFRDFEITKGKMDDVFLAVTGKKLTGGAKE